MAVESEMDGGDPTSRHHFQQLQRSLDAVSDKIDAMAEKPPSHWEKAGILLSVLTPLTIAGLGFYLNHAISERESIAETKREEFAQIMAEKNHRVARLSLMPAFVDALSSGEPKKQLLAIRTINLVMPVDGPAILEGIIERDENDLSAELKSVAQTELSSQVTSWVQDLYSDDQRTRLSAFEAMRNSSVSPSLIADPLLDWSLENSSNKDGVFNTLVYFNTLENPAAQTGLHAEKLKSFAEAVKVNGEKTTKQAELLIRSIGE
jgi:hypothetical protein